MADFQIDAYNLVEGKGKVLYVYPAVFYKQEGEAETTVVFPDLDIYTSGDNVENAYLLAKDLLRVYLTYAIKYDIDYQLPSTLDKVSEIKYAKSQQIMLVDTTVEIKQKA